MGHLDAYDSSSVPPEVRRYIKQRYLQRGILRARRARGHAASSSVHPTSTLHGWCARHCRGAMMVTSARRSLGLAWSRRRDGLDGAELAVVARGFCEGGRQELEPVCGSGERSGPAEHGAPSGCCHEPPQATRKWSCWGHRRRRRGCRQTRPSGCRATRSSAPCRPRRCEHRSGSVCRYWAPIAYRPTWC